MKSEKLKDKGAIRMIDISEKDHSLRVAKASVKVAAPSCVIKKIKDGKLPKGDACAAAKVAGFLAAKNTPHLIPLCHPLSLTHVQIDFKFAVDHVAVFATVKARYATGVEMEALAACALAALTLYDMAKTESQGIVITDLKLLEKTGGKSGAYKVG
jgi:cyclic pyranopterin phosphate synthase